MSKEDTFIDWLCGERVEFPYFKNLPEVKLPRVWKSIQKKEKDERQN